MKILLRLLFLLLLISCKKDLIVNEVLSETDQKSFKLNSTSTLNINSAEFFINKDDNEIFSFLNTNDNSLVYYLSSSPKKIEFASEGENGVGRFSITTSHHFISQDSILILQTEMGKLFLSNLDGKILKSIDLFDLNDRGSFVNYPTGSTLKPMISYGEILFAGCNFVKFFNDYSNYGTLQKINFKNSQLENIISLPKKYDENFWGTMFKYRISFCLSEKGTLLVSFPIDDEVYEYDLEGKLQASFTCKSEYVENVKPFNANKVYGSGSSPDWGKINSYSLSNSDYTALISHPNKKQYYRIVYIRPSQGDVTTGKKIPDFSVIVFDEKHQIQGEQRFSSSKFDHTLVMATEGGLAIARKDLYDENNEELVFSIFNLNGDL